jgi:phosphatidylglycerophosphatase A
MKKHEAIATVFGLGHLGMAPGTWGSVAGMFLALVLHRFPVVYFAVFITLFVIGGKASGLIEREHGVKDPSYVIIDEFSSMFIVFAFVPIKPVYVILGLISFRVFDIIKPPPIKRLETIEGGWGIMLDDALAAVYANLILQVLCFIGV